METFISNLVCDFNANCVVNGFETKNNFGIDFSSSYLSIPNLHLPPSSIRVSYTILDNSQKNSENIDK